MGVSREEAIVIAAAISGVAALVGVIVALINQWLSGKRLLEIESKRIDLEKAKLGFDEYSGLKSEIRKVIQSCFLSFASATHSMCWVTWKCNVYAEKIDIAELKKYDAEMHNLLPSIISQSAVLNSYSSKIGLKLSKLLKKIEDLDARIGDKFRLFLTKNEFDVAKFQKYHREADELHKIMEAISQEIDMNEIIAELKEPSPNFKKSTGCDQAGHGK